MDMADVMGQIDRGRRGQRRAVSKIEVLIAAAVVAMGAWLLLPRVLEHSGNADRQQCLANLGKIGAALTSYLEDSGQIWPYVSKLASVKLHEPAWPTLPEVLATYVDDPEVFHCPADRRTLASDSSLANDFPAKTTWFATEGLSYEWMWGEAYGGKKVGEESLAKAKGFGMGRADRPLLGEFEPFHIGDGGSGFNTLNADLKPRSARTGAN